MNPPIIPGITTRTRTLNTDNHELRETGSLSILIGRQQLKSQQSSISETSMMYRYLGNPKTQLQS